MKLRGIRRSPGTTGIVAVVVAAASLTAGLLATSAGAGAQTKWFTDTVGKPTSSLGPNVVFPVSSAGQKLELQVANDASSNQSFGSADIDLVTNWSWSATSAQITTSTGVQAHWTLVFDTANPHLVHLRNNGVGSQYAIPPGGWLQVEFTFTTPAGGIDVPTFVVKQSNDFSDSSTRGTSNVFGQLTPFAAIYIGAGPPAKLVYGQPPTNVQVTTSSTDTHFMCPPVTALVEDADNHVVSWLPSTTLVTLSSTSSPELQLPGSSSLSANTVNGIATFGAGNATDGCTGGLTASAQGTFDMTASTTVAAGAGYAGGTFSTAASTFTVYLTLCGATCDVPLTGDQTTAGIHATGGDGTNTPVIGLISPAGTDPSGCINLHIDYRPSQTTLFLDGHDKSVDVGWSKKVTNQDPRNGTPFWPVCIVAPYSVYVSNGAGGVTTADATNGALLVACSTPGVGLRSDGKPDLPCISNLYKNAASEHAVVWLPNVPGDPHLF